jgi:hypothetical protein
VLLQNPDDLFFRKSIALHALVLVLGQSELQTGLSPRGKVKPGNWTMLAIGPVQFHFRFSPERRRSYATPRFFSIDGRRSILAQ